MPQGIGTIAAPEWAGYRRLFEPRVSPGPLSDGCSSLCCFLPLLGPQPSLGIFCCLFSHYLTICDPMDYSPPGSSVHGISQARILEWVAVSFSRGSSPDLEIKPLSPTMQADSLPLSHLGSLVYPTYKSFREAKLGSAHLH